jgi:hypothetical protein
MENHILAGWLAMPVSDVVAQSATIPPLLREYRHLVRLQIGDRALARKAAAH